MPVRRFAFPHFFRSSPLEHRIYIVCTDHRSDEACFFVFSFSSYLIFFLEYLGKLGVRKATRSTNLIYIQLVGVPYGRMSVSTHFPEAAFGLRSLFRGLPGVVRRAVFTSTLQRTGCIQCGIGPHSVYDCPHLDTTDANWLSHRLYKQWTTIVGEELMLFGVASTSANYFESAIPRISARPELPRRRPQKMKVLVPTIGSTVNQSHGVSSPLLPLPAGSTDQIKSAAKPPSNPTLRAMPAAKLSPKIAGDQTPKPLSPRQRVSSGSSSSSTAKSSGTPAAPQNSPTESEALLAELNTDEDWDNDNVHIDRKRLAGIHRVAGDLAMPQARLVGTRRGRTSTPGSGDKQTSKKAREEADITARILQFEQPSQDLASSSQSSAQNDGYDSWDLTRYKRAKTIQARGQFWLLASESARQGMAKALLNEPVGTPARAQAHEMLWIS